LLTGLLTRGGSACGCVNVDMQGVLLPAPGSRPGLTLSWALRAPGARGGATRQGASEPLRARGAVLRAVVQASSE